MSNKLGFFRMSSVVAALVFSITGAVNESEQRVLADVSGKNMNFAVQPTVTHIPWVTASSVAFFWPHY